MAGEARQVAAEGRTGTCWEVFGCAGARWDVVGGAGAFWGALGRAGTRCARLPPSLGPSPFNIDAAQQRTSFSTRRWPTGTVGRRISEIFLHCARLSPFIVIRIHPQINSWDQEASPHAADPQMAEDRFTGTCWEVLGILRGGARTT